VRREQVRLEAQAEGDQHDVNERRARAAKRAA
jgi:hypothetical protein